MWVRLGPSRGNEKRAWVLGRAELDLHTLVWTRGAAFPISQLDSRLKCQLCGSRRIALIFDLPKEPMAKRIAGMPTL
jgi:DNA-directed RNA polymerase subunit RPC12/RpoP